MVSQPKELSRLVSITFPIFAPQNQQKNQMVFQLPVYVCLAASWALGEHVGCKGLTNNTRLFGVLYVFATIISELQELEVIFLFISEEG